MSRARDSRREGGRGRPRPTEEAATARLATLLSRSPQRARLGARGVRLGRVEQPGVHAGGPARGVAAQVRLVLPRAAPGGRPRARPATSRRRRAATSTSRSAARATIPLCEANGAAVASSACTTAASSSAGAGVVAVSRSPTPRSRSAAPASRGRPRCSSGSPAAASACIRASACSGDRDSAGASDSSSVETRTASTATSSPAPSRTSAQRRRRALEHRARVRAAQQGLGRRLGRGTPQAAVAQHHVDAVAGGGERRRHALQGGQAGQRVGAHGDHAIQRVR